MKTFRDKIKHTKDGQKACNIAQLQLGNDRNAKYIPLSKDIFLLIYIHFITFYMLFSPGMYIVSYFLVQNFTGVCKVQRLRVRLFVEIFKDKNFESEKRR